MLRRALLISETHYKPVFPATEAGLWEAGRVEFLRKCLLDDLKLNNSIVFTSCESELLMCGGVCQIFPSDVELWSAI